MLSRSLSPPWRLTRGGDADELSMARSSLRPRPLPLPSPRGRPASVPAAPRRSIVFRDRPLSPPQPSSCASAVCGGVHTPPQPQHQEESGSDSELDSPISPPRIVFITETEDQEPGSPTSPPGSPPPIDVNRAVLPKASKFRSNTGECQYYDGEDDPWFNSLVDNFMTAAVDVFETTFPEDDIDTMKIDHQRQSTLYAESALKHYNNDEKNKIKYELVSAITSCGILDVKGGYGHVNFTAKGNQQNSKEELFFAELRWFEYDDFVPTCVVSLKGAKRVGGLCGSVHDKFPQEIGLPIDAQHCYACDGVLKHPKNGTLYESGHIAYSGYYYG